MIMTVNDKKVKLDKPEYDIAINYKWHFTKKYMITRINGKQSTFSKVVFGIQRNQLIYHTNGDYLDFRKSKIMILTREEFPKVAKRDKTSRYRGVFLKGDLWMVILEVNDEKEYLGSYYSELDAAIVADYYYFKKNGIFDKMNFKWKNVEELNNSYKKLCEVYGENFSDRNSKVHQGKLLNKEKAKSSKYVGVYKMKRSGSRLWAAEIRKNRQRYHIGYFEIEEFAAKAYDVAAMILYGENAATNFAKNEYEDILIKMSGESEEERIISYKSALKNEEIYFK